MRILVWQSGACGDVVIASGMGAEGLKKKYPNSHLCWGTETREVIGFLFNNPHINEVQCWFRQPEGPNQYPADLRINLYWWGCQLSIQESFLEDLGVLGLVEAKDVVYTNKVDLSSAKDYINSRFPSNGKPLITIQGDVGRAWTYPNNGNGKWNQSEYEKLVKFLNEMGCNVLEVSARNGLEYSVVAGIIKHSHLFVGAEGSMSHVAAGVGTQTVIIRPLYRPELTMAAYTQNKFISDVNLQHKVAAPKQWCEECSSCVTYTRPAKFNAPSNSANKFPPYVERECSKCKPNCLYHIKAEEVAEIIRTTLQNRGLL